MIVKYTAPYLDYSGYGQASRHHIGAFDAVGVKVIGEKLSYSAETADYGTLGPLMHKVSNNTGDYKIKLLHTTPDEFKRLIEPGKYHIGFMYWETDKVPLAFVEGLNLVDEIWTASQANFDAIRKAGITKPIYIFPEPMETELEYPPKYEIPDFEGYLFYSVFEWIDRKNPDALIRAYLQEFKHGDHVGLLIKSYFRNFSYTNKKMIRNRIEKIRNELGVSAEELPIYLYLDLMDRSQILKLHNTGDCFVSTHRGEGWGVPQVEAALASKPVISTNYGGVHEYFSDDSAYLIPYKMTKLRGMSHSQRFYSDDQNWADVQIEDVQKLMRQAYENRKESEKKGRLGQEIVRERFNFKRVGREMLDRLMEIDITQ